ncbi:hypothetical protein M758_12G064300 [Ceratodon purpureus]|nr:hypothetical protein M758_12G064300 [Ceratodon purpureus]
MAWPGAGATPKRHHARPAGQTGDESRGFAGRSSLLQRTRVAGPRLHHVTDATCPCRAWSGARVWSLEALLRGRRKGGFPHLELLESGALVCGFEDCCREWEGLDLIRCWHLELVGVATELRV